SIKIDSRGARSGVFAFAPSPSPSPSPLSTIFPRPISPRSHTSQPITIRELPDSSTLFCGPALSPPPPKRFRLLSFSHVRAKSTPSSSWPPEDPPRRQPPHFHSRSHTRAHSLPVKGLPEAGPDHHGTQHCHRPDRDHPLRGAGAGGLCDLRGAEPREPIRQEGERARRRGGVGGKRTVRFKLDDDDPDAIMAMAVPADPKRTVSGTIRLEDERHSWF
ncbi:uncharacterized protein A1O9_03544, partial [Exophiala aquamarina CBS 119918]